LVVEHAFGRSAPFTLGLEEELLLVDDTTHRLSHVSTELLARLPEPRAGMVMHDVYEAMVENASPIVGDALEGADALDRLRDEVRECLRPLGSTLIGAGLHPAGEFGDVVHVPQDRYRAIAESMRGLLGRTPTAAVHVHVGMPDPETAIAAFNRVRIHLPVLQALAAHSPWWHGRDSGFATARAQLFRGFPRAAIPRAFAGWEDYAATVAATVAAGDLADYTFLWWDLRPHPRLGTLEIRAMDAQSRIDAVCGLAALAHALAVRSAHEPVRGAELPVEALNESSFRASRDGLAATIWWEGRLRPLPEVARDAIALARPYAADLGGEPALEEVERILREGNGADRMRAAHDRGGLEGLLDHLVDEAAAPLGAAGAAGQR